MTTKLTVRLLNPFATAESLEHYGRNGYLLLALLLLVVNAILALSGYDVTAPVASINPLFVTSLDGFLSDHHLEFLEPMSRKVFAIEIGFYVLGYFLVAVRQKAGILTANIVFRCLDLLLRTGEWCIDHQTLSASLLVILVVAIPAGFMIHGRDVDQIHRVSATIEELDRWLIAAEEMVDESPMTRPESDRLAHVMGKWRDGSCGELSLSPDTPILRLHNALIEVFSNGTGTKGDWTTHLTVAASRLPYLNTEKSGEGGVPIQGDCGATAQSCKRAANILRLLAAKVHVRLAGDNCKECVHIDTALSFLKSIDDPRFEQARNNALGNSYSCVFGRLAQDAGNLEGVLTCPIAVQACGGDAQQCADKARELYAAVKRKHVELACSHGNMLVQNNSLDLLVKIALHFDYLSKAGLPGTRIDLISDLRNQANGLLKCQLTESLAPVFLFTAAQARGAAAQLAHRSSTASDLNLSLIAAVRSWGLLPLDQTPVERDDAAAAGDLLRMALLFDRSEYQDSELRTFCFARLTGPIPEAFWAAASASAAVGSAFPEVDFKRVLEGQCNPQH